MPQSFAVHYVGSEAEVAHHAAPLAGALTVRLTAPEQVAEVAAVGDVAVFFTEHFERFRRAIGALRDRGVATLYALDGILEWRHAWDNRPDEPACPWTMRPVLCHRVACIGRHQARILSSWGNAAKVEVVGLPRLDQWLPENGATARGDASPTPRRDSWEPPANHRAWRVLVATAKFPGFTPEQTELTTQSLADLARWFDASPQVNGRGVDVRWRLTRGLDRAIGVENALSDLTGRELIDQVRAADVVITTASTTLLESMLLDRPTVLLDYHAVPTYVPAAWTIRHAGDIDAIVRSALAGDTRRLGWQRHILNDELECASPALPRFVRLAQQMHEASLAGAYRDGADGPAAPGSDGPFSTLRYQQLADWFPAHFTGDVAPQTVPVELRAELAHARREIENLQRRIAQLSSELAAAHDIFRQIHAHPIAGPVVRVRQRLLDAIGAWTTKRAEKSSDHDVIERDRSQ